MTMLAETKSGAVIRKLFGTDHISQRHAVRFDTFCCEQLNPLLNFHRPRLFPTDRPDPKKLGRVKRVYRSQDATTLLTKLAAACLVRIAPARGPPLWEASAAAEQADKDPQWDSSTQPALGIEFDQRIAW